MPRTKEEILETARSSERGWFLLPGHTGAGDAEYDACQQLVRDGRAKWLSVFDQYAPGIVLTGEQD